MGMMGGGGGPTAGLRVLTTPEGEKELNITADQKAKLQELNENFRSNMMEKFQGLREELENATPEERTEKMQAIQKDLASSVNKDLKEILNADQLTRYKQINLQAQGFGAFSSPEVVEKLKLTAEQKTKLKEAQDALQADMQDAFQQMQDDREAGRAAMTKAQTAAKDKALALLTSEQKSAWSELTGKPFTMPAMQPPGGRRRVD
jgi:Spy/CpxP family protein refolding chaperone